MEVDIVLNR